MSDTHKARAQATLKDLAGTIGYSVVQYDPIHFIVPFGKFVKIFSEDKVYHVESHYII